MLNERFERMTIVALDTVLVCELSLAISTISECQDRLRRPAGILKLRALSLNPAFPIQGDTSR